MKKLIEALVKKLWNLVFGWLSTEGKKKVDEAIDTTTGKLRG